MVIFLTIIEKNRMIISYQRCGVIIELDTIKPMYLLWHAETEGPEISFFHNKTAMVVVAGVMYVCMNDCVWLGKTGAEDKI